MDCRTCGTQLPPDANACPICGTFTSAHYSNTGTAPDDPTFLQGSSSPSHDPALLQISNTTTDDPTLPQLTSSPSHDVSIPPPPPPLQYGSTPSDLPTEHPYEPNPYAVPPQSSPIAPAQSRTSHRVLLVVASVLILGLLVGGGVTWVLLRPSAQGRSPAATPKIATTATLAATTYPPADASLVLNDPLSNNSQGYGWREYQGPASGIADSCRFIQGAYVVSSSVNHAHFCYATDTSFSELTMEIQMKIFQGDCGGILLRSSYYFAICQQGAYAFGSYQNNTWSALINHLPSSAIHQGLNQTNLVAVVASGYNVDLYINHQKINSINTGTDVQGDIGVYASSTYGNATQVMFSNLKVWT